LSPLEVDSYLQDDKRSGSNEKPEYRPISMSGYDDAHQHKRQHETKVKSVHEAKAEFKIEFEDGSSVTFCLADPGSSVAVRYKNNAVEYLG
jgi:hypothetical protein